MADEISSAFSAMGPSEAHIICTLRMPAGYKALRLQLGIEVQLQFFAGKFDGRPAGKRGHCPVFAIDTRIALEKHAVARNVNIVFISRLGF